MTEILYRHRTSHRRAIRQQLPTGELVETRGVIASALALGALAAGLSGGGAVAAGAINSRAAGNAAKTQSDAATRAAEIQAQSARESQAAQTAANDKTLAYQKEQDALTAQRYDAAQRGNYNQYVSKVKGAQSLGSTIGFNLPDAAPYVSATEGGGSGAPSGDPKIAGFIADWQKTHPASEGIAPLAAALKQAGLGGDRFMYGQTPSDNELVVGGQKYKVLGGENTPGAYWYQPGMNDGAPAKGGLPNSIASYLPSSSTNYGQYPQPAQPFQLRSIDAFRRR